MMYKNNLTEVNAMSVIDSKKDIVDQVFKEIVAKTPLKMNKSCRRKVCSLPTNHFGPIPDIPVGMSWKYRLQVSESGIHRPVVAGIHGRENEGAYSIVLSGVYEEDHDYGEYFLYSGCGGKERDKSRRLGPQVFDQELTRHNKALAICCNAPINNVSGANALDKWREGKPVRVVRKHTLGKFSEYAPKEGYRYDGIYKVVRYYPINNKRTGLRVWTYELRRDDCTPPPWTPQGIRMIEELNLKMILPEDGDDQICSDVENDEHYISSLKGSRLILKKRTAMPKRPLKRMKVLQNKEVSVDRSYGPYRVTTSNTTKYNLRLRLQPPTLHVDDIDVKPSINEFSFSSGSDIPWATSNPANDICSSDDVKPSLQELSQQEHVYSDYTIDIQEQDVKPDVAKLDAMIVKRSSNREYETEHSFLPSCLPVSWSTSSLQMSQGSDSQLLPGHLTANETCVQPKSEERTDFRISKVSSVSLAAESREEKLSCGLGLLEKSPIKLEPAWDIPNDLHQLINEDPANKSTWDYLKSTEFRTQEDFLNRVKIMFSCPNCANIVDKPITTHCLHNICYSCLETNFKMNINTCSYCRSFLTPELTKKCNINIHLIDVLNFLFPR